jgi:hypothetical protein
MYSEDPTARDMEYAKREQELQKYIDELEERLGIEKPGFEKAIDHLAKREGWLNPNPDMECHVKMVEEGTLS